MMPEAGMPGRYERIKLSDFAGAEKVTLPSISSPKTPENLANGKTNIDMANPPKTGHDPRVKEGTGYAWIQDNVKMGAGGTHRYRKDFESDDKMRFIVWDPPSTTLLAQGPWFTVDNTFLRVNDPNGATYDYLYTVTKNNDTLYHISFQAYEPGDFRMFMKTRDGDIPAGSEPASNATTYNQGASKYIPPSVNGTMPTISSSSRASSSSVAASSSSRASSSSVAASYSSSSTIASSSSVEVSLSSSSEVDASSSSEDDETPILSQIVTNNLAVQIKNGVNLQVASGAIVEIYCIKGNLINRQNYKSGVYILSLANLPKGMYLVKVGFGSDMKILRVPVL